MGLQIINPSATQSLVISEIGQTIGASGSYNVPALSQTTVAKGTSFRMQIFNGQAWVSLDGGTTILKDLAIINYYLDGFGGGLLTAIL